MSTNTGWIGVDLDGTLARYEDWQGAQHIGEPVPAMVERVKAWRAEGIPVKIFTARVGPQKDVNETIRAREAIEKWCLQHLGEVLPITATKDFAMRELWDDRCVQVVPNTGIPFRDLGDKAAQIVMAMQFKTATPEELQQMVQEFAALVEKVETEQPK